MFPGMIPSGVVSRPISGRVVRTLGGELVFPGMIPYSRSPLFITGGCLFTTATSRRRALGWPVNAHRAVATAFARLAWRLRAADSGSVAASIASLVSGRVARGSSGYTIPGLSPWASPASLRGLVTWRPEGSPEKGLV